MTGLPCRVGVAGRRLGGAAILVWGLATACGDDTGPLDARGIDAIPPGGTISLTWTIADQGSPLSCGDVGVSSVTLSIVPDDQPFGMTDSVTCSPGAGTSRPLTPGVYDVTVSLAGLDAETVRFDDVVVTSAGDTPIGAAAFDVDASGGFSFRISAGGQGNCTPPAQGGAGITGFLIELLDDTNTCVDVTFDIAAGATQPAGTYTTSCATPAQFACIAQDQLISVAPTLTSGFHRLNITGLVGADSCWTRQPQFTVPAGGATAALPLQNLVLNTANPVCDPP